VYWNNVVELDL